MTRGASLVSIRRPDCEIEEHGMRTSITQPTTTDPQPAATEPSSGA
jgi:hypothetical protein